MMKNVQSFQEIESYVADLYAGRRVSMKPYVYVVQNAAVGANSVLDVTFKINGNADFVLVNIAHTSTIPITDIQIQIVDSATQETLFNSPVDLGVVSENSIYTTIEFPSIGLFKQWIANSNQVLKIGNVGGGAFAAGTFAFFGVQVFEY